MAGIFGIEELIKTDKIIVIFGTGKFSARLSNLFRLLGIKIAYFLDNNESVWNQTFFGAKVSLCIISFYALPKKNSFFNG